MLNERALPSEERGEKVQRSRGKPIRRMEGKRRERLARLADA